MEQYSPVQERFARFVAWTEESQAQIARRLGCSQTFVSKLMTGGRALRDLSIAMAIRRESADWPEGPIEPSEWERERPCSATPPDAPESATA